MKRFIMFGSNIIISLKQQDVLFHKPYSRDCLIKKKNLVQSQQIWDPHLIKDSQKLEKVQRSASRYVFNNYIRTPGTVTSLLQSLQWDTLEKRRESSRLAMIYKIENELVDLNPSCFYNKADSRTRGIKIFQERPCKSVFCDSFFPKTLSQWNKLPPKLTEAKTLGAFKHGVGCCLQSHTI